VVNGTIAIAHKALQTAMDKVKALTPRGTHHTLETTLDEINQWYVGWSNYYSLTYYPAQLKKIEAHIRRRLKSRIVDQQKRKKHLYRKLIKRGVSRKQAGNAIFSNNKRLLFCIGSEEAVASVFCPQHRAYGSVHGSSRETYPLSNLKPMLLSDSPAASHGERTRGLVVPRRRRAVVLSES
jgi:hypothetical protein